MLKHVSDHASEYRTQYGNVSAASIGAIQRQLLTLENEGAEKFFGEPSLNLQDWMQTDNGKGIINILNSEKLMRSPRIYSAFLLWMLAELFETLPEVGDLDKPKFVMFFDEAHLMFDNAANALVEQIEQVVRLIRSKGVGVYFVTQNPLDLPDTILGQLGNRVQHALRAFTPRDQKAVKAAAETFRSNPNIKVAEAIAELGVGEALVSFLDEKGMPEPVERALILPPQSSLTPLAAEERNRLFQNDDLYPTYKDMVDNYSAFEALAEADSQAAAEKEAANAAKEQEKAQKAAEKEAVNADPGILGGLIGGLSGGRKKSGQGLGYNVADAIGSQINRQVTNAISRSVMGIIKNMFK